MITPRELIDQIVRHIQNNDDGQSGMRVKLRRPWSDHEDIRGVMRKVEFERRDVTFEFDVCGLARAKFTLPFDRMEVVEEDSHYILRWEEQDKDAHLLFRKDYFGDA